MSISVITTVYNRAEYLRLFLDALAIQSRKPDEVVIADDGSDADTQAKMEKYAAASGLPVRIIRQEHNGYRLAAARNKAILASSGEYLVFLDCDTIPLPDTLALHAAKATPHCILAGDRGFLNEATTQVLMSIVPAPSPEDWQQAWETADLSAARRAQELFQRQLRLRRWHLARAHKPKLLGCHFSLWREDIDLVNGFDENFVGWGYEDDDFVRRLYKTGVKPVSVIETARAMHLWHPTLAPVDLKRRRDRPNRAYFRRWFVPAYAENGLQKN